MKTTTRSVVAVAALLLAGSLSSPAAPKAHPDTTGWENLFASDLSNAEMKPGSWVVADGVLVAKTHDTIWTKKSYDNFVLDLEFNGEEVFNVDLNDWKEARKNPDGTKNKFAKALKDFARKGPLGLQGLHGKAQAPVWYRNLKIKELK